MSKKIKVVVFDLDGTLADTANIELLQNGYRHPYDVLRLAPPIDNQKRLLFDNSMIWKISYLIQCGIHVYLITRSPKPYASTLSYLLGVDFCGLIPANNLYQSVENKLKYISIKVEVDKSELLYVGDLAEDELAARNFGCLFQYPVWLPEKAATRDYLSELIENCSYVVNGEQVNDRDFDREKSKYEERLNRLAIIREQVDDDWTFNDRFGLQDADRRVILNGVFVAPSQSDEIMKTFVNPHVMTRFEYETDQPLRFRLFELLNLASFDSKQIAPPDKYNKGLLDEIEIFANFQFSADTFGTSLWSLIKDWNMTRGSGPKTHMHYLELVALGMSAGIYDRGERAFVVPVPSSPISPEHPGQVSFRLAHRISELTDIPILNLMHKNEEGVFEPHMTKYPFSKSIYLVDDQLTKGNNAKKCIELLHEMGVWDIKLFTWTSSKFQELN